jgi:hypothetical protein
MSGMGCVTFQSPCTTKVNPDSWIKHFGELFTTQELDLSVGEVQILGPYYIEELDIDFMNQEVKNAS